MIQIGHREIGKEHPCFIIAELSANHQGSLEVALDTIKAAKQVGADAVKLQTYTPDTITLNCKNDYFRLDHGTIWDGRYLYDLYQEAYTPWEWHEQLFRTAQEEGLICFSSPFDPTAVDFLESLNTSAYKVASFEIQDIPLIQYIASKNKPVIISTGIAEREDIKLAIATCKQAGNSQIVLLQCTSSYPAPLNTANLRTMADMEEVYQVPIGLSDHTQGYIAPVVAVSLGAVMIEKHFILDRSLGGPDASFSMTPDEFKEMVQAVRSAEESLGQVTYEISDKVKRSREIAGRSLFVVQDIKAGEVLTKENIRSIRPGFGMHPKFYFEILGKSAKVDILRGTPLEQSMINWNNEQ